jgi:hypothetical protein
MAEHVLVGMLIPNLFVRVPVESAVRGAGAAPRALPDAAAALASDCPIVVVDLDALRPDPATVVGGLTRAGKVVLGFGPHVEAKLLAAARAAGAVVFPRSAFLGRLPELLAAALATARGTP